MATKHKIIHVDILKKKPKKVFSYSIMPFTQIFEEKKNPNPAVLLSSIAYLS